MANDLSSIDIRNAIEQFKKWFFGKSCPEALNLLITGKTGVGKSRLVNALVGHKVAEEGRTKDPCTSRVMSYDADIEGVPVIVWDSPGLQDGTTNEDRYIQDMKRKIQDVSLMIYCVRMDETRFHDADKKAIRTLTDEFGKEVWNHAVVALTFANKVENPDREDELKYFKSQLEEWKKQFDRYFASIGIDKQIPVIPVGNKIKSMRLPDRENWLSYLWIECFQAMKASATRGMYRINRHRLKPLSSSFTSTPAAATATYDDDIPSEIPLNVQQQNIFLKTVWNAFVSIADSMLPQVLATVFGGGVGGAVAGLMVSTLGSKILQGISSSFF